MCPEFVESDPFLRLFFRDLDLKEARSLIVAVVVMSSCRIRGGIVLKAVVMRSSNVKIHTVKRLKPEKAMKMIHMLQATNIAGTIMMKNAITRRDTITMMDTILTNYDSISKSCFLEFG